MSKGYLVIAQNSGDLDYIRMAYALCLSIKNTQSVVNEFAIAVEEGTAIPDHYAEVFDHVITIPWMDHAKHEGWKIHNKWKYFYMTPFDETVVLDTDMIFTADISYWWDALLSKDFWFTTNVRTYKNEIINDDTYRKTFTSNKLPNVYTAFMYFRKSTLAAEIFKMTEIIFNNWEKFYYEFLDENRPKHLSGDVAFSLAVKILGVEHECTSTAMTELPTFVHMKSYLQNIPRSHISDDWTNNIPCYFNNNGELKVGNFKQIVPFHYHIKSWLTDDVVNKLEGLYNDRH